MVQRRTILTILSMLSLATLVVLMGALLSEPLEEPLPTLAVLPQVVPVDTDTPSQIPVSVNNISSNMDIMEESAPSTATSPTSPAIIAPEQNMVPQQAIIRFRSGATEIERQEYINAIGAEVQEELPKLNSVIVQVEQADSLPESDYVEESEPDYYATALISLPVNDPMIDQQWGLQMIGAPQAWLELPDDAPTITVAVIDSGACFDHPDMVGRYLDNGYDFVEDDTTPQDEFGHGCAASGIIAANVDDGVGMAGVAPNAKILPIRVLNENGIGVYSDVAAAIVYATDRGAAVINLSLGGENSSSILKNAIDYATERGVVVVAAAGNTNNNLVYYPAAYDNVVAVGSLDSTGEISSYSSRGDLINTWAPGSNILVTSNDGHQYLSGTSMAAAHVSGQFVLDQVSEPSPALVIDVVPTASGIIDPEFSIQAYTPSECQVSNLGYQTSQLRIPAAINNDGSRIAFASMQDLTGANPSQRVQVFLWDVQTGLTQLTNNTDDATDYEATSISNDGKRVLIHKAPVANVDAKLLIWDEDEGAISSTIQISYADIMGVGTASVISGDGQSVVFPSADDVTGENPDNNWALFSWHENSGFEQITNDATKIDEQFSWLDISYNGSSVVWSRYTEDYHWDKATGEITEVGQTRPFQYRNIFMSDDGHYVYYDYDGNLWQWNSVTDQDTRLTILVIATTYTASSVDSTGKLIAFHSDQNLVGNNTDGTIEVFLWSETNGLYQITNSTSATNFYPVISGDGQHIVFVSMPTTTDPIYADSPRTLNLVTCSDAPNIAQHPQSQTINNNSDLTLTVTATGEVTLNYQWYEGAAGNISNPVGTNSSTLNVSNLTSNTSYWVRVSNAYGSTDSVAANIDVLGLAISPTPTFTCYNAQDVPQIECTALEILYQQTDGDNWAQNTNWRTDMTVGNWHGVTVENGHVTRVELPSNKLNGIIPAEIYYLENLQVLNLRSNQLVGELPTEFVTLDTLISVDVSYNGLYAANNVDTFLSNRQTNWKDTQTVAPTGIVFTNSTFYSIDFNWTAIPYRADGGYYEISWDTDPNGDFDDVFITESKHINRHAVNYIPTGTTLYFRFRTYTPAHANNPNAIWSDYSPVVSTVVIIPTATGLPATVTSEYTPTFTPTPSATYTPSVTSTPSDTPVATATFTPSPWENPSWTSTPTFTPTVFTPGPTYTPTNFCHNVIDVPQIECEALEKLYIRTHGNNWEERDGWLSDTTVDNWYGVFVVNGHVEIVDLNGNNLYGTLPTDLGSLSNLRHLNLSYNPVSGTIPVELGNLSNLEYLHLDKMELSGGIPPELGNLSKLWSLNLRRNQLTGSIPASIGNLTNLDYFTVEENHLSDEIPGELGNLSNLQDLSLRYNQFSGAFPAWVSNLTNLESLLLSGNQFIGEIPSSITTMTNLDSLEISYNRLSASGATEAFVSNLYPNWQRTQTVPPSDLAIESNTNNSVTLHWTTPTLSGSVQNGFYEISYAQENSINFTAINTSDKLTTDLIIDNLEQGVDYQFRIRTFTPSHSANQTELWSEYSEIITFTIPFEPLTPPDSVIEVESQRSRTKFGWHDTVSGETDVMLIERSMDNVNWRKIIRLPAAVQSFTDDTVTCGNTYYYRLRGYRIADGSYSPYSSTLTIITDACAAPVTHIVGLYKDGIWQFRDSLSSGAADVSFSFGPQESGWLPIVGDWNGNGEDGIAIYKDGLVIVRTVSEGGAADMRFTFGPQESGWLPIVGDWNGDDIDTLGIYKDGVFMLSDYNDERAPQYRFIYGPQERGYLPISGDWNGSGSDTVGLYKDGSFYLNNRLRDAVLSRGFNFGPTSGWYPLTGDWDADGVTSIGVSSMGVWRLRNSNSVGAPDIGFNFGSRTESGWIPLASYRGGMNALEVLSVDTPTLTPTLIPTDDASPTIAPPTMSSTPGPSPTVTPITPSPTFTPGWSPTSTAISTLTPSPLPTNTLSPTFTPSPTGSPTPVPTATYTPTLTPSHTPSGLPTPFSGGSQG